MIYQKTMELHMLSLLVTLMTNFACSTSWSDSFSLLQCLMLLQISPDVQDMLIEK